jgi:hypothetical protein
VDEFVKLVHGYDEVGGSFFAVEKLLGHASVPDGAWSLPCSASSIALRQIATIIEFVGARLATACFCNHECTSVGRVQSFFTTGGRSMGHSYLLGIRRIYFFAVRAS